MNNNEQKLREIIDFEFRCETDYDADVGGIYFPICRKDRFIDSIIAHPDVQALLNGGEWVSVCNAEKGKTYLVWFLNLIWKFLDAL